MWKVQGGVCMNKNRFLSELFVVLNYDENFPKSSLIMDEENLQLLIQVKDGSKFRIMIESADNVNI